MNYDYLFKLSKKEVLKMINNNRNLLFYTNSNDGKFLAFHLLYNFGYTNFKTTKELLLRDHLGWTIAHELVTRYRKFVTQKKVLKTVDNMKCSIAGLQAKYGWFILDKEILEMEDTFHNKTIRDLVVESKLTLLVNRKIDKFKQTELNKLSKHIHYYNSFLFSFINSDAKRIKLFRLNKHIVIKKLFLNNNFMLIYPEIIIKKKRRDTNMNNSMNDFVITTLIKKEEISFQDIYNNKETIKNSSEDSKQKLIKKLIEISCETDFNRKILLYCAFLCDVKVTEKGVTFNELEKELIETYLSN